MKDAANGVFTVDTKADGGLKGKKKKKVAPVSTCSSAANLRPTLPGLPVRTIALVSAQSGKLPFQFSASYKVRVWESLSLSHFTVQHSGCIVLGVFLDRKHRPLVELPPFSLLKGLVPQNYPRRYVIEAIMPLVGPKVTVWFVSSPWRINTQLVAAGAPPWSEGLCLRDRGRLSPKWRRGSAFP